MNKQIIFDYKDKTYTLEYTRATVSEMERKGFIASQIAQKPMTTLPELFAGAFKAHHRAVMPKLIEEIYESLTNKEELIGKLAEMYNDPIMTLVADPEDDSKNVSWTAAW